MTSPLTRDCYYLGCYRAIGHYLWGEELGAHLWDDDDAMHRIFPIIDGGLCPQVDRENQQIEGAAALHHKGGWTALAFWDRSGDHRPGSNSVFIFRGELTFDDAVARAKEKFPDVWGRFQFDVKEAA